MTIDEARDIAKSGPGVCSCGGIHSDRLIGEAKYFIDGWNAAIEKAAKVAETSWYAQDGTRLLEDNIRSLKEGQGR